MLEVKNLMPQRANKIAGRFLVIYQATLLTVLPFYLYFGSPQLSTALVSFALLWMTGLSITAGYHRYYSHRAYKTNKFVEFILLFLGSMAGQGSALRWSFDHRNHHAYVDTDDDPYSIKKGFWYAHFTWIFDKPKAIDKKVVSDLIKNDLVVWQHNNYVKCMLGSNALVFILVGFLCGDFLGSFILAWWTRFFVLHHSTWFINSLAHMWGDKPFSQELSAVDNYFLSMLTFGEGYHNYHHTFANDYRNGIRWYHFDPTKWLIWTMSKLNLATGLRKTDAATIDKRMVIEHKSILLERLKAACVTKQQELEEVIQSTSENLMEYMAKMQQMSKSDFMTEEQKQAFKELKKKMRAELRHWKALSYYVMKLQPQTA